MGVKLGRDGEQIHKKKCGHLGFVLYSFFRAVRALRIVLAFFSGLKSSASIDPCVHAPDVSGQIAQRAHTTPGNLGRKQGRA